MQTEARLCLSVHALAAMSHCNWLTAVELRGVALVSQSSLHAMEGCFNKQVWATPSPEWLC